MVELKLMAKQRLESALLFPEGGHILVGHALLLAYCHWQQSLLAHLETQQQPGDVDGRLSLRESWFCRFTK